jgi:hypothetical protein
MDNLPVRFLDRKDRGKPIASGYNVIKIFAPEEFNLREIVLILSFDAETEFEMNFTDSKSGFLHEHKRIRENYSRCNIIPWATSNAELVDGIEHFNISLIKKIFISLIDLWDTTGSIMLDELPV